MTGNVKDIVVNARPSLCYSRGCVVSESVAVRLPGFADSRNASTFPRKSPSSHDS
jgi:hypothetical protein